MGSISKYRNRFLAGVILLALLISGGLLGIMHFYGDEVKKSLLAGLNERIEVEVSVDDIHFDLFTNFPRGSLRLKGINSREKTSPAGNSLLKAGEIALIFNMFDFFRGEYKIEKINLHDAFLNLFVQEDGNVNYQIFKEDTTSENNLSINLKKVHFKNVVISYIHLPSQQEYLFRVDAGDMKGIFSSRSQQFQFNGLIHSTHIKSGKHVFLIDRLLSLDIGIAIDRDQHTIHFLKGDIHSEGLDFKVTGNAFAKESEKHLSLAIEVERSSIKSLIKLIPPAYLEPVNDFTLNGDLTISASLSGNFSGNHIPLIEVHFTLADGAFLHKTSGLKLSSVRFEGNFTNGKAMSEETYHLSINNISSVMRGSKIEGSLEITNFVSPGIHTRLVSTAKFEDIAEIFHIDTLRQVEGMMELNLEFRNQLKNFRRFTIHDFISSQTSGTMKISDMSFRLKESPHDFQDFNGVFKFNNQDLKIENFSGFVSGNDFFMKGYFRNILAFAFIPGERIFINADFKSENFNLDRILRRGNGDDSETTRLVFSDRVNYNLNIEIDTFTFRKFSSTHNIGQLIQQNRTLLVNNTRINSMDGQVTIDGSINGQNDDLYTIECTAGFGGVDIQKLFRDFGNFGQNNITSDHLRGHMEARVNYRSSLTPSLFVDKRSVFTLADITISEGELIRYLPLKKLSRFVREEELGHVRFSTLKNKIKIEKEMVFIPQMDIESSSLNLSLYGEHSFDNKIDYHVQLLLSEIIARRDIVEEDLGDNFVEDDGLGKTRLFLSMTGSADDPLVKYDTREVRSKITADLRKEKGALKKVFRDEFGRDTGTGPTGTVEPGIETRENKSFTIEWEETRNIKKKEQDQAGDKEVQKKDDKDKQDFIIQWDERRDTIDRENPLRRK